MYRQQTSQPGVVTARTSKAAYAALILAAGSVIFFLAGSILLGLASMMAMSLDDGVTKDMYYLEARKGAEEKTE